jgi:predicted dehydrogenase
VTAAGQDSTAEKGEELSGSLSKESRMSLRISRRTFLMGTAGAAALAPTIARAAGPGEKVRIGIIGCGGQGEYNWSNVADEDVRIICDVDLARTARAAQRFPSAQVVQDFRRVIDRDDLDAVVVSTPDHWHAIPSVWAMQTGKHVYCEKPLAHSVYETRVMIETARKNKRITQMGTQIHAGNNYRRVVELVRAGAVGKVKRVDVWCEKRPDPGKIGLGTEPPSSLDYEMWLGPAPYRPYDPKVLPFNWRWWWEFGGGVLADMACHYADLPFWALDLPAPKKVSATGTQLPDADNKVPAELRVDYQFPERDGKPAVHLVWWHGIGGPRDESGAVRNMGGYSSGVLFTGDQGELLADYSRHKLLPEDKFKDYVRPEPTIPNSVGHHREWLNAIKSGGETTCNFDYSGALTEAVLLGNVSYRLGREIEWDAKKLKVKNVKEKEWGPLVRREYRGDWKLKR